MRLSPLSGAATASMPQVLESSWRPPVPNPILESQVEQWFSLFPMIPILALVPSTSLHFALNPSLLQLFCKEPWEPKSAFQVSRPSDVARNCSSAISECSESAPLFMVIKFVVSSPGIFIPKQILKKGVFQYVGSLVSCVSNPVSPPATLKASLLLQRLES